jgi:hypothetical protein
LGAFYLFFPLAAVQVLLTTFFLIKAYPSPFVSSFVKLNNFLILEALFGPRVLGHYLLVSPSISFSPFLTTVKHNT